MKIYCPICPDDEALELPGPSDVVMQVLCDPCVLALRDLIETAKRQHAQPSLADRLAAIHDDPDPEKR
jgi:hypothetical protein